MDPSNQELLKIRGRLFTTSDIQVINCCVDKYYSKGRTFISREICRILDWRQPNGWLKDRACRDVLLELDKMKLINLPPSQNNKKIKLKPRNQLRTNKQVPQLITQENLSEIPSNINLLLAKGNKEEPIWNRIIQENHYLGHKVIVGRCLKYLIVSENKILGAIAFSSPAWRLKPRDILLNSLGITLPEIHNIVINNSRFLILGGARVDNFASHVLSLATKKIITDWEEYYSIKPLFVETFVQPSLFHGTCYKAANWVEIGITKGYAKSGASYHNSQEPKKIFLYGLTPISRTNLSRVNTIRN